MIPVKIKRVRDVEMPTKGTEDSVGYDLYVPKFTDSKVIGSGETYPLWLGIKVELPKGTYAEIHIRSSLAIRNHISLVNSVGIIDSDYRGEWQIKLRSDNQAFVYLKPKTRIAQFIVKRYEDVEIEEVEELSPTDRGEGGIGSTGE